MNLLTPRQSEVLDAINLYRDRTGFPPTIVELAGLIGCSSANAAAGHVKSLQKKGYISVAPGVARGITVLKNEWEMDPADIIMALLNGSTDARENAVAWLEARGVKP
ncbi:LexA family transcriptional regulator [Escherichia coli]|uniref:LexA family protein n=1 Tax=Escherichia coli TaxID=562 RepID=UPI0017F750D9|nr:LexA family transcriptional regulator [Escherichia coli]EFG9986414.1 LexA family transcriptional regulator [Escherichia coli]MCN5251146.1 LexA family transcriptional regulator [Escherichia coli]MCN9011256.1 LexA family transcriptional regulator [Escherichia coli]